MAGSAGRSYSRNYFWFGSFATASGSSFLGSTLAGLRGLWTYGSFSDHFGELSGKRRFKIGTVGPVIPGGEVKIAADGEILYRGPNVMMGYYHRPELTSEAIDGDGWLHTGDVGEFDGIFLKITDRKKEMFKTSGGKYIAPQQIENRMKESKFIAQIMIVGENRKFPAALIVPAFETVADHFRQRHVRWHSNTRSLKAPK